MARRFLVLMSLTGAVLLFPSAVALAAVRTGTAGSETLSGTPEADRITGRAGDDRTVGKAGNDTYLYADGWGRDTVVDSRGVGTLNFSAVTGPLLGSLCPEFSGTDVRVTGPGSTDFVTFAPSIEGTRGGQDNDTLSGCGGKDTISGGRSQPIDPGGPLSGDLLLDFDGPPISGLPAPSDDVYDVYDVYLGSQQGMAVVGDAGGSADILNLGGVNSRNAFIAGEDLDEYGAEGSLVIIYESGGVPLGQMVLTNQFENDEFADVFGLPFPFDGRIEKIKFKDKTVTVTPDVVEPGPKRQGPHIAERLPENLSTKGLLP